MRVQGTSKCEVGGEKEMIQDMDMEGSEGCKAITHAYRHKYISTHIPAYTYAQVHTHAHIHTHTYTHTPACTTSEIDYVPPNAVSPSSPQTPPCTS